MPERNRYTDVAVRLGERLGKDSLAADKADPIPFGMEKVTASEQHRHFEAMTLAEFRGMSPEERRVYINETGVDAAMDLVRQARGA